MVLRLLVSLLLVCLPVTLAHFGEYAGYGGCPKCWDKKEVHPMVLYCKATYALKIKAEHQSGNTFLATVLKDYKNSLPFMVKMKGKIQINTDCSTYFQQKKPYLILANGNPYGFGGFSLNMQACDFAVLTKEFPCTQRSAFDRGYDCKCANMCACPQRPFESGSEYQTRATCFNKYVLCSKNSHDPYGKCIKTYHHYYKPCVRSEGRGY